jgi:hypothetical protein
VDINIDKGRLQGYGPILTLELFAVLVFIYMQEQLQAG